VTLAAWVLRLVLALAVTENVEPPPELASAITAAAEERPLAGEPARMAAVLVAIAWRESRFKADAVGDKGQSVGVWQISRYWKPPADVAGQARKAAELVVESFRVCARHPLEERLGWYASGGATCGALAASRGRMHLAGRLLRDYPR
jgi:hypothetical protein